MNIRPKFGENILPLFPQNNIKQEREGFEMDICIDLDKNDSFFNALHMFPINYDYNSNLADKVQNMAVMLYKLYQGTMNEVQSIFTINEATLIVSALLLKMEPKADEYTWALYSEILNVCEEKDADVAFNVNRESLLKKIDQLTEFQAFTLRTMVNEIQREVIQLSLDDLTECVGRLLKPVE